MKVEIGSPEYEEAVSEIDELAMFLYEEIEETGAGNGTIIGALTLLLAVCLDRSPDKTANEVRARVVSVLKGKIDG
ncbi:MAG TPA: hypothetical protein VK577_03700 [Bradyrhizobium sp.]|nr:hypothetical protein [Bradyrhizobium sp.]